MIKLQSYGRYLCFWLLTFLIGVNSAVTCPLLSSFAPHVKTGNCTLIHAWLLTCYLFCLKNCCPEYFVICANESERYKIAFFTWLVSSEPICTMFSFSTKYIWLICLSVLLHDRVTKHFSLGLSPWTWKCVSSGYTSMNNSTTLELWSLCMWGMVSLSERCSDFFWWSHTYCRSLF